MGNTDPRRILKGDSGSASYCCEAAGAIETDKLPPENAFDPKRAPGKEEKAASYCCEAAGVIPAENLPPEDAH
ncbi:MAG: hypothetical protein COY66_02510 [Candidatus Kerfeldbacteria bacterium CG_4_10_14_0_8_um_filter_42_10]|uniref:Uncharacterized protein n=1 Tax=Candidatus Kerfeldbacteria bacterium CG_4_10_14_0_8_um_filter_42_10 TaxID=2014248 RepID=A0A2M7RJF0_9BACT|nr:MAG: hypothetical protein COY66_02510 [Candidatus Kerfeldbacteria bacterium CG_4_10_14_0_8_um_filter_42_10]